METATISEVQHNLAACVRKVEHGQEVEIRRRNHVVARLVPAAILPAAARNPTGTSRRSDLSPSVWCDAMNEAAARIPVAVILLASVFAWSCGTPKQTATRQLQSGADILDPVEYQPVGEIALKDGRSLFGVFKWDKAAGVCIVGETRIPEGQIEKIKLKGWVRRSDRGKADAVPEHTGRIDEQRPHDLSSLVPVQSPTRPEESDRSAIVAQATNLFEAGQYSNCVALCRSNAAVFGAEGLYIVAECHAKLADISAAFEELRAIEAFYEAEGSRAAMRMAIIYREAKQEIFYVAELHRLIRRYPGSNEAKEAERLLRRINQMHQNDQIDWPVDVE